MIAESRACVSKFVSGVSEGVVNKCRTFMLVKNMEISNMMVHPQQIKEEKGKEKKKKRKWVRTSNCNFSQ